MSRTGRSGRGTAAAARLLALLAVALGLLAMHGLASTHHPAAAASPGHATTAAADLRLLPQDQAEMHRHDHSLTDSGAVAALPDGAAGGPAAPACGDECPSSLAVLCAVVAVAAATTWLVTATARRGVLAAPARSGPQPRAPDAARRLLPGPDPVAELCVSRT